MDYHKKHWEERKKRKEDTNKETAKRRDEEQGNGFGPILTGRVRISHLTLTESIGEELEKVNQNMTPTLAIVLRSKVNIRHMRSGGQAQNHGFLQRKL